MTVDDRLLLLDLDRTLLDTDRFLAAASAAFDPRRPERLAEALAASQRGAATTHRHDLAAAAALLDVDVDAVFARVVAGVQGTPGLLYPDADTLLARARARGHTAILTIGDPHWQTTKLVCTGLAGVFPYTVVDVAKRDAVAALWPDRRGWLVDDKPDQRLPDGWTEVWLDRGGAGTDRAGVRRIRNLHQVPAATFTHPHPPAARRRPHAVTR